MKKLLITFSGANYNATTQRIVEQGRLLGADDVRVYDDKWLMTQDFYKQNRWLWDHPHKRGFGWYAWKPYIIWHALQSLNEGDAVMYVDADTAPVSYFGMLYERCVADGGVMLFASENHAQHEWCKQDCYDAMAQPVTLAQAGVARFMLFQKGPWKAEQFLMEWLTYTVNPLCNTFDVSTFEHPGFIEHRAEQAIMTNLAHKYGLKLYREACQAGNGIDRDRDLYGLLFEQVDQDTTHVTAEPLGSRFQNVEAVCVR